MNQGCRRTGRDGFTLIELLVVVLIIGILASIAMPQYFKVVERARLAEAQTMLSSVRSAEERLLAKDGNYATDYEGLSKADITFQGGPPTFGMKYYMLALDRGTPKGCAEDDPRYALMLIRITPNAAVIPRYYKNYMMLYERCANEVTFPGCPNCAKDFTESRAMKKIEAEEPPPPPKKKPPPSPLTAGESKRLRYELTSPETSKRRRAILILQTKGGTEPEEMLGRHLRMEMDPALRREIVAVIVRRGSSDAWKKLLPALRDLDTTVRMDAVMALRELKAVEAAPAISELLFDQDYRVRREAMRTLSSFQQTRKPERTAVTITREQRAVILRAKAHAKRRIPDTAPVKAPGGPR